MLEIFDGKALEVDYLKLFMHSRKIRSDKYRKYNTQYYKYNTQYYKPTNNKPNIDNKNNFI